MSLYEFKSKLIKYADYKEIDLADEMPEFTPDMSRLEKDVKRLIHAKGKKEEAETVASGDLVEISIDGGKNKYVVVGKGLFDAEAEKCFLGKGKETVVLEDGRSIQIFKIEHTILPEISEEEMTELRRVSLGKQVADFMNDSEAADMVVSGLFQRVSNESEVTIDESELCMVREKLNGEFGHVNMNYNEDSVEDGIEDNVDEGMGDEAMDFDISEFIESMTESTLKAALIGFSVKEKEGTLYTEQDYETEISRRACAYKTTAEEAKEKYPVFYYFVDNYSEVFFNMIEEYVSEYMLDYYFEELKNAGPYDVAIIGAGPAGLSAALNLKFHNKKVIWFGTPDLSDKVEKSESIANLPGLPRISGKELNEKFRAQIKSEKLRLTNRMVTTISKTKTNFMILADNEIYEASKVLLATGTVNAKGFEGEERLLGHGVSYCATCDGFLYKGKAIAVFCGAKRYEHEVKYLAEIADKVYLYAAYPDSDISLPNIEVLPDRIKEITGEDRVDGLVLSDRSRYEVSGVFVLRTAVAPAAILKGIEMDGPHIVVDRNQMTSIEGVYAAGDCTGRPYQLTKAMGEGNVAAHAILENL